MGGTFEQWFEVAGKGILTLAGRLAGLGRTTLDVLYETSADLGERFIDRRGARFTAGIPLKAGARPSLVDHKL